VAWSKAGPGATLSADTVASCAAPDQSTLLLRKFIRDTWDDPTGVLGSWGHPEHGAWVEQWMQDGLGL